MSIDLCFFCDINVSNQNKYSYSEEQNKPTICPFLKQTEVILRRQNIPLKFRQPLELLMYIEKGFRSFHTGNMGSVGQRAAKLLSVKL